MFIRRVDACLTSFFDCSESVVKKQKSRKKQSALRHAAAVSVLAFVMAAPASLASQAMVEKITVLPVALVLLSVVILIGILFDIVGVAAMAASEAPLNSMASHNVFGARQAVRLVRNAHRVASICNDVIGDVTGALSGAIGVSILFNVVVLPGKRHEIVAVSLMTAAVAALIVAGKAYAKSYAMRHCTSVMLLAGRVVSLAGGMAASINKRF